MKPKVILNPDKEIVRTVKEGLKQKDGYCPCRMGKEEKNKCKSPRSARNGSRNVGNGRTATRCACYDRKRAHRHADRERIQDRRLDAFRQNERTNCRRTAFFSWNNQVRSDEYLQKACLFVTYRSYHSLQRLLLIFA